jgi:hypothetical protein
MYSRLLSRPSRRKAIPFERLRCRRQLLGTGLSPFREVSLLTVATRALVTAMTRNGVPRLVCITALGVGDSRGHSGFVFDRLFLPCCSAMLKRTRTVRKPRSAPAYSIGSSSGPPCSPMTQLVGASGPSPTSQASKAARLHAPMSLGSWWSN